jgi:hypothetical protein
MILQFDYHKNVQWTMALSKDVVNPFIRGGPIIRALYWLQYIFIHNVELCTKVWALYGGFCHVHTLGLP